MSSVISTLFNPRINAGSSVHGQSFIQGERIRQDELLFKEEMFYHRLRGLKQRQRSVKLK